MDFMEKLDIILDKEHWYAGECLKGHVLLTNSENIKIRGVRIFLRGKGHTEWRVMRSGDWRTVSDDQTYLDNQLVVWGPDKFDVAIGESSSSQKQQLSILPRGHHRWPFEFFLPESCLPYSFESKICHIRYYVRVVVDIPYASNPNHMKHFSIIGPYIDCMDQGYLAPHRMEITNISCLCCPLFNKPKTLTVQLERSAYCSGENIKLHCIVYNGTDSMHHVAIQLIQNVEFHVTRTVLGLSKDVSHVALEYHCDPVKPKREMIFDLHQQLQVPTVPPTLQVEFCKLLQISYTLRVMLVESNKPGGKELTIDLPITIATVPFRIPNINGDQQTVTRYAPAIDRVEGGRYISTQFRLGEVYDGSCPADEAHDMVLYKPVYVVVAKETRCILPSCSVTVEENTTENPPNE